MKGRTYASLVGITAVVMLTMAGCAPSPSSYAKTTPVVNQAGSNTSTPSGWKGIAVSAKGAPPLPVGTAMAAPVADKTPTLGLPRGTSALVRKLLTPVPTRSWPDLQVKGILQTDRIGEPSKSQSPIQFSSNLSPNKWTWHGGNGVTHLQIGDSLYNLYGTSTVTPSQEPSAASPYQYAFALFPEDEYMLVQVMLSVPGLPQGTGHVAGQPVTWLAFQEHGHSLRVAVDTKTDQVMAVSGRIGLVGNQPQAQINHRVTSYVISDKPFQCGATDIPEKGIDSVRAFDSFRQAQLAMHYAVVAPKLDA